jgi:drug/metabolite transporter (DMT)-like permease
MKNENRVMAYLALGAICFIWGTTYTAIKYSVQTFPPFYLVGMRQTLAGLVLLVFCFLSGRFMGLSSRYVGIQAVIGVITITGGNGFITWAMQFVSSGLSAVIGALTPLMVVLINWIWLRNRGGTDWRVWLGVLLGFFGLAIIFSEGWTDFSNPKYVWGIAGCFASCVTWSLGTVMAKVFNSRQVSTIMNAGLQIFFGGLAGFLIGFLRGEKFLGVPDNMTWCAIGYLGLVGSALAFSLYMFVLNNLSAAVASLYTYINPVVAILLGWLFLGEHMGWVEAIGMVLTIFGVWLANRGGG